MAVRSLGQLTLDLVTRTGGWATGLDAAERRTKQWRRQVESDLRKMGSAFKALSLVVATAGAAAGGAFGALAVQTINSARELERFAQLSNTSTQEFQRMAFGAERFGIEQEKLADILKDTTDRVGDFIATGGGPMADFFENIAPQVGVTAEQFARLSGPEALQLYVSSLQAAGVSQAEMIFYMEAIASDAAALVPLLANNGEEMRRLGDEAERTGNVFSELEFEQLMDAKQGIDELTDAFAGMKNEMVIGALPAINDLIDTLNDPVVIESARELAVTIADGMNWAAENSDKLVDAILFVVDAIDGVVRVAKLAGSGIALMVIEGRLQFAEMASDIYSGPIDAINTLIDQMNRLPGVDLGAVEQFRFVADIEGDVEMLRRAAAEARADMQDILLAPMASDRIRGRLGQSSEASGGDTGGGLYDKLFGGLTDQVVELVSGFGQASDAAVDFAKLLEEFNPALNENVQDILDRAGPGASIDADGVLRDAFGNALPTLQRELDAELRDQLTDFQNQQNLSQGLLAAAEAFITGANEAARQAWQSLSPATIPSASRTGDARPLGDLPGLGRLDRSAREASAESGGRNLGTLRLTNDRGDSVEVQGEQGDLTRWLADTLSSAAGSV